MPAQLLFASRTGDPPSVMFVGRTVMIWLAALLIAGMPVTGAASTYSGYLRLDGRWYGVWSPRQLEITESTSQVRIEDTTASKCRRASGAMPSPGNLVIGIPNSTLSYSGLITLDLRAGNLPTVITITTPGGDIQCAGEVAAPDLEPVIEVPMFVNGFE